MLTGAPAGNLRSGTLNHAFGCTARPTQLTGKPDWSVPVADFVIRTVGVIRIHVLPFADLDRSGASRCRK
jgi:hypothetical protein